MLEISAYFKNFDLHKDAYATIHNELLDLYQDYTNDEKIVTLFEYWLFSLSTLHRCYGFAGLRDFMAGSYKDPIAYSMLKEFGMEQESVFVRENGKGLNSWLDRCLSLGYRSPGAPNTSYFSRLHVKYSKSVISQISCVVDSNLNLKLSGLINTYLDYLNIYLTTEVVSPNIPTVFKSYQVKCYNSKSSTLCCAPIEIIQFKGYERIFLQNRKINVFGYAHGGGYDVALNDPLIYFEKKISDRFIGWGFSEENTYQTRYLTVQNTYEEIVGKIIWIESGRCSKFTSYCYPLLSTLTADEDIPSYIYQELLKSEVKYFNKIYPGKLQSNRYEGLRGSIVSSQKPAEELLKKNDIVIFDNCMPSLMYHCLENNILFLIVEKRLAVEQYTPKMLLWYKILRKNNLLFHDDECGFLSKKIKALDFPRVLPEEVHTYYKNIFNSDT